MTTTVPAMTETELLANVIELAAMLGWHSAHFRPALTSRGWRTPVQGTLGKGFPDLVLVRARDRRLVLAELKSDVGKLSPAQDEVLEVLRALECDPGAADDGHTEVEVHVWRPRDWDRIVEVLR